jgi:hypothetical protein
LTTEAERQIIYKMYCGIHNMIAGARRMMDANVYHEPWDQFGDLDDTHNERKMNKIYDEQSGVQAALKTIWDYYAGLYSKWDIEQAIQEGEARIGSLPYVG